jgi:hypothetical protein
MIEKIIYFSAIFIIGEIVFNTSLFPYLKKHFSKKQGVDGSRKILCFDISTFKGLQERFVLYFALSINLPQILIVYGALKIGTRFEKNEKIKNDYFLIGNFSSIIISILYYFLYLKIIQNYA